MGLLSRIFGRRRRDLFAEAEAHHEANAKAIRKAFGTPNVQATLASLNLGVGALERLQTQLLALGVEDRKVYKAIRCPDIIRWYFTHDEAETRSDYYELVIWVKQGVPPRDVA